MNCQRCDRQIRSRSHPESPGLVTNGRGLCRRCHSAAKADGTLDQYDKTQSIRRGGRRVEHTAEDFAFYVEMHGGERAGNRFGWSRRTRRLAADRLGMSLESLDRALYRHLDRVAA